MFRLVLFMDGTAIDLTLNEGPSDQIMGAGHAGQIFTIFNVMLSPKVAILMSMLIVVL